MYMNERMDVVVPPRRSRQVEIHTETGSGMFILKKILCPLKLTKNCLLNGLGMRACVFGHFTGLKRLIVKSGVG